MLTSRVMQRSEAVFGLRVNTLLLRFRCAGIVPAFVAAAKGLPLMRVTRTMFASAAVAAAVALSAPAAHAVSLASGVKAGDGALTMAQTQPGDDDGGRSHHGRPHHEQGEGAEGADENAGGADDESSDPAASDEDQSDEGRPGRPGAERAPSGAVKAGGGGLAQSSNGLAAGSVLLLGGLGAGAYMLRRRAAEA
ncbi:hypothetical protein [Streptomyces sp. NPDC059717]|uniref:hypothetical protein n=2 Tax=Streptomyces TaxID=1883 RepID=UPI00369496A3